MKIYLTRHGQDEDNLNGILNGHRDKSLTNLGIKQAGILADSIKENNIHFDVIYSSPLGRAFKTAEIISHSTGGPNPNIHELLIERDFGVMTGVEVKKVKELCAPDILQGDTVTYFLNPEGAETFPDLINRAKLFLSEMNEKYSSESILLVSHGDIGKMLYAAYYNLPWKEVLTQFHFGNSELLLLSEDSPSTEAHIFKMKQHNH